MSSPQLTILIPTMRVKIVKEDTIKSILNQTFQDFEVIILSLNCDSSLNSETFQVADSRFRVLEFTEGTFSQILNQCLKVARGTWVTIHDPEGISLPTRFEEQTQFLTANPQCDALGTGTRRQNKDGDTVSTYFLTTHEQICDGLLNDIRIAHETLVFNKDTILEIGGFRETPDTVSVETLDLTIRVAMRSRIANLPRCLYDQPKLSQHAVTSRSKAFAKNSHRLLMQLRSTYQYREFWKIPGYTSENWTKLPQTVSRFLKIKMAYTAVNDTLRAARTLMKFDDRDAAKNRISAILLKRPGTLTLWFLQRISCVWVPRILFILLTPFRPITTFVYLIFKYGPRRPFYHLYLKRLQPRIGRAFNISRIHRSSIPIDVIIPATEKDAEVLPFSISSVKEFVRHPVTQIFIVSPESEKLRKLCAKLGATFVLETDIIPVKKSEIKYEVDTVDRSGWLLQQFIKLNSDHLSTQDHFLVLDADTCFVQPVVFLHKQKVILNCSDERHDPYYQMIHRILNHTKIFPVSFVAHHMMFEKSKLRALKQEIESKTNLKWHEAILKLTDRSQLSGFSEYETYGNFCSNRYPKEFHFEYWFNLTLSRSVLASNKTNIKNLVTDKRIKTLSFHHYNDE